MPHYRDRAEVYFATVKLIADDATYGDAVPLLSIHCAISLADSILVQFQGQRGSDPNHKETLRGLRRVCSSLGRDDDGIKHLTWLLQKKTDFIYGDQRLDQEADVKGAKLRTERFFSWAYKTFPEIVRTDIGAKP